MFSVWVKSTLAALSLGALRAAAFDNSRSDNNSYGATHPDPSTWQKTLSTYCQDDAVDVIPLAFVNVFFGPGNAPSLNLANTCNPSDEAVFPGTTLPNCNFLAADIKTCQAKGKAILLSLGGATGAASFSSADQATQFGDTIWNLFLGGSSSTRPFGDAVLDGIDIDVEGGGTQFWDSMVNRIRTLASGASKKYYVTAAPQCPYPDAYQSQVLNAVEMDAVFVQFYNNNGCQNSDYNNGGYTFDDWDNWAKTVSKNKNVKIYIGALAAPSAGGTGYVDVTTLSNIALETRSHFSSFGGVMLWDASQAYNNGRIDMAIKNAIRQSGSAPTTTPPKTTPPTTTPPTTTPPTTTPPTTTPPTTTPPTTTPPSSGGCAGVAAWSATTAYNGGQKVTYNGHLWTAKWWTYGSTPGGSVGDWQDSGAC
ncbi:glycoside hydrolase [Daedaleopsis nitida]|nr:glycoside hydrolase [Daedaleopsis nitida]